MGCKHLVGGGLLLRRSPHAGRRHAAAQMHKIERVADRLLTAALLLTALLGCIDGARAAPAPCSRPIRVASSPVGLSMTVAEDGTVAGPDRTFLTQVGARIGCEFHYDVMSRARAFQLMAAGETDLVPSAIRTEQRDGFGDLVVLYRARALLFSLRDRQLKIHDTAEFLASGLSLDLVRGYDYGTAYRGLRAAVAAQGRLVETVDPAAIARQLLAERIDATIMSAPAFGHDAVVAGIADRLAVTALDDLPAYDVGIYLVRSGLEPADAILLAEGLRAAAAEGRYSALLRTAFVHPPWALDGVEFVGGK